MIIHNITYKVSHEIHDAWLAWLQEEHVPGMISTGCFTQASLARLLETDESEGITYSVQLFADSKAFYNQFNEKFDDGFRQLAYDKWGDQFIAFRSVMQLVQ